MTGWIRMRPSSATLARADALSEEADARARAAGAHFRDWTGHRAAGQLGELAFREWLERSHAPHRWHNDDGESLEVVDFTVCGQTVAMKAAPRNVDPRPDFNAVVPYQHDLGRCEQVFFASYTLPRALLWLVGGIASRRFFELARRVKEGEQIGPSTKALNDVWCLPLADLLAPSAWLAGLR